MRFHSVWRIRRKSQSKCTHENSTWEHIIILCCKFWTDENELANKFNGCLPYGRRLVQEAAVYTLLHILLATANAWVQCQKTIQDMVNCWNWLKWHARVTYQSRRNIWWDSPRVQTGELVSIFKRVKTQKHWQHKEKKRSEFIMPAVFRFTI